MIRFEDLPDVLTPGEVQSFLRLGRNATYDLLRDGTIRSVRLGQKYLVPREAVGSSYRAAKFAPEDLTRKLDRDGYDGISEARVLEALIAQAKHAGTERAVLDRVLRQCRSPSTIGPRKLGDALTVQYAVTGTPSVKPRFDTPSSGIRLAVES